MADERPPSPDRRRLLIALGYGTLNAAAIARLIGGHDGTHRPTLAASAREPSGGGPKVAAAVERAKPQPADDHVYDLVIKGGRVIDAASNFDRIADVGIDGSTIGAVNTQRLHGRRTIDATNKVVSAGFIDLLSYEPEDYGAWYKIGDGVTTNLGMHGINAKAVDFFARYEGRCVVHFGGAFDNPWIRANLFGINPGQPASPAQVGQLADECDRQIHDGWIGVDFEPEYTPGIAFDEMKALAAVAKRNDVPCFFHGRYSAVGTNMKTLDEIIEVAKQTGARVHVEHIISTGGTFDMAHSLQHIQDARDQGYDISACMYPYDFWATYLASPRFNPGWQQRFQISYGDLQIAGSNERLTESTFRQYQRENKLAAAFAIPEGDVRTCLRDPHVMIGSDAILTNGNNHPRATGCFSRTLGRYARDNKVITLPEALAKMTILPALRLQRRVPALRKKGRLQRGADADITVFDPATVIDTSTIENPAQYSKGIEWVLIMGQVAKNPSGVDHNVRAGQAIKPVLA
ncbi:MAG: amidohydrolase family protein [Actinomycetota bacterium]|nr:amidohydrolase family protein [Actinomycetota bacterium]